MITTPVRARSASDLDSAFSGPTASLSTRHRIGALAICHHRLSPDDGLDIALRTLDQSGGSGRNVGNSLRIEQFGLANVLRLRPMRRLRASAMSTPPGYDEATD